MAEVVAGGEGLVAGGEGLLPHRAAEEYILRLPRGAAAAGKRDSAAEAVAEIVKLSSATALIMETSASDTSV